MRTDKGHAHINDSSIHYEIAGAGEALILIHGFSLDTRMWDSQFECFSQTHRVLRYDVRGYGKSRLPKDNDYFHTDDLKALMDYLNIPYAHLIGLSMGGGIAITFALDYPEMVMSLILVGSTIPGYVIPDIYRSATVSLASIARSDGVQSAISTWLNQAILQPAMTKPDIAVKLRQIISDYSGHHWLHPYFGQFRHSNAADHLIDIDCPTLVIVGKQEMPHLVHCCEILYSRINNAQKAVLANAGHITNMENPDLFNQAVKMFLSHLD